ncbi:MAG: peroxiredoxin, partial [Acidobacteriota bacterium]|nr:peroxiredoxin [Acidobacteriota bacterium]
TFSNEVVRVFQNRCQSCHHPGDIAPFSLMTYADAAPHADAIKYMTQTRQMPPWKATPACGDFADARVLNQNEIDVIAKWVDNGAPEGNVADLPTAMNFNGGWTLGQPDLVLSYSQPYTPPVTGDMYRCFPMPTNLPSDTYVSAIDIKPGDRQTVHHVIAYIDTSGDSQKLDDADAGPGYTSFGGPGFAITNLGSSTLGGWAPGARPVVLPDDVALLLPAQSRVVLQVHYHPHGIRTLPDQTQIGIYFAKKKPNKIVRILPLINQTFTIPPNDSNYKVTTTPFSAFVPVHLYLIAPHMHLLGRKMHVTATLPNGSEKCLINVDDWDFNWQGMYRFSEPVAIPTGTKLALEAYYDNSTNNWRNPNNPPKPVSWGEQTTDEMCIAFLGFTIDAENLATGQALHPERVFGVVE